MIGEPAFALGNTIIVGENRLEVERACSGLRIFMGIAALAYAYVMLVRRSWWEKCLLMVAIVPIALISNAVRIATTAFMFQHISVEAGKKFSHDAAGVAAIVLAAGLFVLLLVYLKWLVREYKVLDAGRLNPGRRREENACRNRGPAALRPMMRKSWQSPRHGRAGRK